MKHLANIAFIVPVYNPQPGWQNILYSRYNEVKQMLKEHNCFIVIVSDGNTGELFEKAVAALQALDALVKIVSLPVNCGKGAALRAGVKATEADYYIYTDVDFPYTAQSMLLVSDAVVHNGYDIAIGNRSYQYYVKVNSFRANLSKLLRFFIRKLLRIPFDDTQCGLKAFNHRGREIFLSTTINRYLFDMEFVIRASKDKTIQLKAVPAELRDGIHLSRLPLRILLQELQNFIYLLRK